MGLVCARTARSRGRNMAVWFMLGVLFSFVALLVLWILPSKAEPKSTDAQVAPVTITGTLSDSQTPSNLESLSTKNASAVNKTYWHYINSKKETLGPISFSSLQEKWHAGEISSSTYVWEESMEGWKKIEDLPKIAPFFGKDSIS